MKMPSLTSGRRAHRASEQGALLVIVLWIALGLVSITLYFGNTASLELRASENRIQSRTADQAIEGAARYITYILSTYGTNGLIPTPGLYQCAEVPLGEAHFWIVGRTNYQADLQDLSFCLVDEGSKLNLNSATAPMLELLPQNNSAFAAAIVDWRDTNSDLTAGGAESESYGRGQTPYPCKNSNFESVDELRLVYGATVQLLAGEDINRNGMLDANEPDEVRNGKVDAGLFDYVTVFSSEPNTGTNISNRSQLSAFLNERLGSSQAARVMQRPNITAARSPLEFFVASGLSVSDFAKIADGITTTNATTIEGRVNINTASAEVLACLPGIGVERAAGVVAYRESNPQDLNSVAWLISALGSQAGNSTRQFAQTLGDMVTTKSYQFSADVVAVGARGRGYRRVRFVFDTSSGQPKIIYRQDLTRLGWALGKDIRERITLAQKNP